MIGSYRLTRPQYPVELPQGRRLVLDVDQHRPGGDDVCRLVRHAGQGIGGGQDEPAPVKQPLGGCGLPAVIKQVLRDIGEDHLTRWPETVQRAERDEAVTCPHVEEGVARTQPGLVQHRVPHRVQGLAQIPLPVRGVAAESHVQ